ncbi:MAG: acetamidase/formamidase family protein, partial [Oscillospiraceae bacterium]|nr:acetamidase/formamidase family protein [Oscillospiraceae bacterium]
MRITRDKIYHQFAPEIAPCVSISSGDRMTVETLDSAGGRFFEGFVYDRPNPATGPIYVNGAMPGDTLEVEVHDIKILSKGFLSVPNNGSYMEVEVESRLDGNLRVLKNELYNNKIFPAKPMIGVIGVAAPVDSGGEHFSVETGNYGGNMDNNAITAGVKVYLPVFVDGALLGIGDIHAVMGDGEVFGQGVE